MKIKDISAKSLKDSGLRIVMIVDDNFTYKPLTLLLVDDSISNFKIHSELKEARNTIKDWQFSDLIESLTFPFEELPFDEMLMY